MTCTHPSHLIYPFEYLLVHRLDYSLTNYLLHLNLYLDPVLLICSSSSPYHPLPSSSLSLSLSVPSISSRTLLS